MMDVVFDEVIARMEDDDEPGSPPQEELAEQQSSESKAPPLLALRRELSQLRVREARLRVD